ncbi:aspartate racemase [Hoeflea halophila]|uniref:Aspartate racemase n=1 Tax=Hoeflea halophila TaxID=714899 RepID=A0A286I9I4_9HYPH|nr:amino acid racemase [Hoeflea halophila]SOE16775.1 aspartate racemase [Hoeflea halophila]
MKLIGLLGGLGWESTSLYYRMLNELTRKELGGDHAARILLHSVNNGAIREAGSKGDSSGVVSILCEAGRSLKAGGADFLVLATNSMHRYAEQIEEAAGIELLHISDVTSAQVRQAGHRVVGLLGTRATMESDFYSRHLGASSGAKVICPGPRDRIEVDRIIFDELDRGIMRNGSREFTARLIDDLCRKGAEAIVLGCSELTTIISPAPGAVQYYDTTRLHAQAAVHRALEVSYA